MKHQVHIFLNGNLVSQPLLDHLPRKGDTVRLSDEKYATVSEVIWCFDEPEAYGQRVNLRLESLVTQ